MIEEQPQPFPSLADARFVLALVAAGGALLLAVAWVSLPAQGLAFGDRTSGRSSPRVNVATSRRDGRSAPSRAATRRTSPAAPVRREARRPRTGRLTAPPRLHRRDAPTPGAARATTPPPPPAEASGSSRDASSSSPPSASPPPPPPPPAPQPPPASPLPLEVPQVADVAQVPALPQLPPPPVVTVTTPELP